MNFKQAGFIFSLVIFALNNSYTMQRMKKGKTEKVPIDTTSAFIQGLKFVTGGIGLNNSMLKQLDEVLSQSGGDPQRALCKAIDEGYADVIKPLVVLGAKVDAVVQLGHFPRTGKMIYERYNFKREDPRSRLAACSSFNLFDLAVEKGNFSVANALIEEGVKVSPKACICIGPKSRVIHVEILSPIERAYLSGNKEMMWLLCNNGAKKDVRKGSRKFFEQIKREKQMVPCDGLELEEYEV